MGLTVFQALDKAIEAGGNALAGKDIAGAGRSGTQLLNEMCSSGLREKTAAKGPKYTVTKTGRESWQASAGRPGIISASWPATITCR